MADTIQFPTRYPFTGFPTWNPNEYERNLVGWLRYLRQYHAPLAVGPVTMYITGCDFQNLISHSGYYHGLVCNKAILKQPIMSVAVKNIEQLDHVLSLHVIALKCRPVPVLSDFRCVNIRHFIKICLFYDLHVMLDQIFMLL